METKTSFWEKIRGWGEIVAGTVTLGTIVYAFILWNLLGDFLGIHWDLEIILNLALVGISVVIAPQVIVQGLRRVGILKKKEGRVLIAESDEN